MSLVALFGLFAIFLLSSIITHVDSVFFKVTPPFCDLKRHISDTVTDYTRVISVNLDQSQESSKVQNDNPK